MASRSNGPGTASTAPTGPATTSDPSLNDRSAGARVRAAVAEPGRGRRFGRGGAARFRAKSAWPRRLVIRIAIHTAMTPTVRYATGPRRFELVPAIVSRDRKAVKIRMLLPTLTTRLAR